MRQPRIKAPPHHPIAYYHCVSRVVDKQFKFGPVEKDQFVAIMEEYAQFCGVNIVSYCIMSNHFHLLVEVPKPPEVLEGHDWLLQRLDALTVKYPIAQEVRQKIAKFLKIGAYDLLQELVDGYKALMWDISSFMKLLKQRFSARFNKAHDRDGTLWESRFHSTLIEGAGSTLAATAAYIELNPLRAGMVSDPANYTWSSYGRACQGDASAMEGIRKVVAGAQFVDANTLTLEEGVAKYRGFLIGNSARDTSRSEYHAAEIALQQPSPMVGERKGNTEDPCSIIPTSLPEVPLGLTKAEILAKVLGNEPVSMGEFLKIRVRYFTDGGVLGSKGFVEEIFHELRERFGPKRKVAAHRFRGLESTDCFSLRNLRKRLFG